MNQGVMLNAYPDSLGGNLAAEADFLARPECRGAFRSFYILPSLFNSDLDRGFSVASYDLNRLLADRNRRSRRIWRVVAGVLIGLAALTVLVTILLMLLNATAFRSITTDTEQTAIPIEAQP